MPITCCPPAIRKEIERFVKGLNLREYAWEKMSLDTTALFVYNNIKKCLMKICMIIDENKSIRIDIEEQNTFNTHLLKDDKVY